MWGVQCHTNQWWVKTGGCALRVGTRFFWSLTFHRSMTVAIPRGHGAQLP